MLSSSIIIAQCALMLLQYGRAKSSQERTNLFCVVLDSILTQMDNKLHISGNPCLGFDDIQAVVGALCLADAAESVGFALKYGLKSVGKGLFKAITAAMSRDIESGRLNSRVCPLVTITELLSTFNPVSDFIYISTSTILIIAYNADMKRKN